MTEWLGVGPTAATRMIDVEATATMQARTEALMCIFDVGKGRGGALCCAVSVAKRRMKDIRDSRAR